MRLKSKYKLRLLIIFIVLLIIFFLIKLLVPKSYISKYKYKNYDIIEKYNRKTKLYSFDISYKKEKYTLNINMDYTHKRHLIKNIKKNDNCLVIITKDIKRTVCKNGNDYIVSYVNDIKKTKKIDSFNNINIYDYNNKLYYIWNYNNFITISNDKKDTLKLFNQDHYQLDYITKIDNNLIIANYNEEYSFKSFFLVNPQKNNYKELQLKRELTYSGYIVGTYNHNVYIYDNHYGKMFRFNPFKNYMYKSSNEYYNSGKWEKISINKLNKHKYYFKNEQDHYSIIDNKLYYDDYGIITLVYNKNVDRIIYQDLNGVYFISGDKLYFNDYLKGTKLLMQYSEWNFNNKNIYIFDN